jgi:hypothetical protein
LPSPIGSAWEFTSTSELPPPSIAMSSRAQKMCWWIGAVSPAATSDTNLLGLPGSHAMVLTMPVALTSKLISPA